MFVLFIYKLFRIMIWNAYKSVEVKQLTLAVVTWLIHPILLYRDNIFLFFQIFIYIWRMCMHTKSLQ